MTIEILLIFAICYLVAVALFAYRITTVELMENKDIEPIEIKPEKKEINSIVAASKSEFLKPPPPKHNPAQVPAEEVPKLFDDGKLSEEPEMEYNDEVDVPERDEVIGAEEHTKDGIPQDKAEPTQNLCMDYMQMERTITNAVRGTVSIADKEFLEQLEGTELMELMYKKMTTTNLELVRKILNIA